MKKKTILTTLGLVMLIAGAVMGYAYSAFLSSAYKGTETVYVFIEQDDTQADVEQKLSTVCGGNVTSFKTLCKRGYRVKSGRYGISPGMSWLNVYRKLRSGVQDPVNVVIPAGRELDKWCEQATKNLALDHNALYAKLQDKAFCESVGLTPATITALIVPNTYQMYWDVTLDDFVARLKREYETFWDGGRDGKCEKIGYTRLEVITLASIVDQETSYNPEKRRIAGVYINRLKQGMKLQSDPTVIFANDAWGVHRVTNSLLQKDSPYNTYKYAGLPPGPICVANISTIDAVLDYESHDYLYFCAKEDFSGSHNFASNFADHQANARKYQAALDARNIKH